MPTYQPLIPTGTVDLDVDYQNLQGNFEQANIVYGTDHYPFDNATPNQGFHNVVTTPPYVATPPTGLPPVTAANPKLYSFQQYAALGQLQYSRGPNNAVPTALTKIHSGTAPIVLAPGGTTNVIDFTGFTFAICIIHAFDANGSTGKSSLWQEIYWDANVFQTFIPAQSLIPANSGNILQVKNNTVVARNNVYWTLEIIRVQ